MPPARPPKFGPTIRTWRAKNSLIRAVTEALIVKMVPRMPAPGFVALNKETSRQ